jgi:hypothetical protein
MFFAAHESVHVQVFGRRHDDGTWRPSWRPEVVDAARSSGRISVQRSRVLRRVDRSELARIDRNEMPT